MDSKGVKRNVHNYYLDETISILDAHIFEYFYKKKYEFEKLDKNKNITTKNVPFDDNNDDKS